MSYQLHTHRSGLRIAIMPDDSPVSYIGFVINAGTRDETVRTYGMAHLVEHMLFKGTRLRSSKHIIQRVEEVGAELNAYTTKEETFIYASFPEQHLTRILVLLLDIVRSSSFPADELEKEKTVIIDEINSYCDSPSELIYDELENILYRGSTLGHNILGTEQSVARTKPLVAQRFFRTYYRPDNMLCFVRGRVALQKLLPFFDYSFGAVASGEPLPLRKAAGISSQLPARIVRRKDTYQQHTLIGAKAYSMHEADRVPLSLLINVLGGPGMNSRLNMSLRERYGLVYNVDASYTAYSDTGIVSIYYGCAHKHSTEAMSLTEAELIRLMNEPLTEDELKTAKRQLKGQMLLATESRENTTLSFAKSILHYGKYDSLEKIHERIDAIRAEDLLRVARETLAIDKLCRLIYN